MTFEITITDSRTTPEDGQRPRITVSLCKETHTLIRIDGGAYYGRLALDPEMAVLLGRILCSANGQAVETARPLKIEGTSRANPAPAAQSAGFE